MYPWRYMYPRLGTPVLHQGQNMPGHLFNATPWTFVGVWAGVSGCRQRHMPRTWDQSNPGPPNTVCRHGHAHKQE